ncbi:hypothetical protein E2C01_036677 [Portunus trituberculatus]|uniref:Uncharacterized protein n=1 Tax=Portunus trituberculatus TaxID=210409 RepID=A0A5B7F7B8_PORTR|nr:hypothetical protein [Portunus trituberculatus]
MRLQYENSVLKKAAEGGSSEQLPMLQTLVADLQERQASLTQENRWGSGGNLGEAGGLFSPHSKLGGSLSPPLLPGSFTLPDFHFSSDRKLRVIRKNLKWASESDLLILRQPKGLLFHSSSSPPVLSFSPQPNSLPPLPTPSCATLATQTNKETPIVIRHIHEFKMPPSPTNEDSGCCRTSPSSCEEETHTRDFAGTLDSGISGMFPGTLESGVSGVSGVYRCLSPVIPPIVEECTAHHLSDLLPCNLHNPTIFHHSHPAHTSTCLHCCSSHPSPRPHSVCSYNPPHASTTQPNTTPPLSPLTATTTPNTTTHTHSPKLDTTAERSPSPNAATAPLPVSPTGRRSAGGGYTRTPIPPESPTPHNSPRLPNSINATRCRTKVSPTLGLQEALVDIPSSPNTPKEATERMPKPQHTTAPPTETQTVTSSKVKTPSTVTKPVNSERGVRGSVRSESEDRRGSGSSTPPHTKPADTTTATKSPSQPPEHRKSKEESFITCLPSPSIHAVRRSEGRIERNSPAYSSMQLRREAPTLERNSPLRASVQPVRERRKDSIGKVRDGNSTVMPVQPFRDTAKVKETSSAASSSQPVGIERRPIIPAIPAITAQPARDFRATNTTTYRPLNTANLPYTHTNLQNTALPPPHATQQPRATTSTHTTPLSTHHPRNTSPVIPLAAPVRQPTDRARPSPKASPRTGRGKPSQKQPNHVKFREPVVSQVSHSDPTASPRERVSPHRPQEGPRKAPDVTLLSDNLFTRFEVAKLPHPRVAGRGNTLSTDTDTDLETLERRLTLGMYAAPLVSSESCTSFSHDDYTDAASDDLDYYNPMQYKAYGDGRRRRRASSCPRPSMARPVSPPRPDAPQESALGRTYSFFRRQKSKKQHKVVDKTLVPPLGQAGHVVKPRNKTAKVVVAETLNAVFTLCTP